MPYVVLIMFWDEMFNSNRNHMPNVLRLLLLTLTGFSTQSRGKYAIEKYNSLQGFNAKTCMDCKGYCEEACPYLVKIQALLAVAHNTLTLNIS